MLGAIGDAIGGAVKGAAEGLTGGGQGGGTDFAAALGELRQINQEAISNSIEVSKEQTESKTAVKAADAAKVA